MFEVLDASGEAVQMVLLALLFEPKAGEEDYLGYKASSASCRS
jgi:hypothetical protein